MFREFITLGVISSALVKFQLIIFKSRFPSLIISVNSIFVFAQRVVLSGGPINYASGIDIIFGDKITSLSKTEKYLLFAMHSG